MRYYTINIVNAKTGKPVLGADQKPFGPWTSWQNGITNPGALDIELDIGLFSFDQPFAGSFLKIWGVGLTTLYQAAQFNPSKTDPDNYNIISIYGGMQKGLPLANPVQNGLLIEGAINQAFGNWCGLLQSIDFVIYPQAGKWGSFGTPDNPKNIVLNWQTGQTIGEAVTKALQAAFVTKDGTPAVVEDLTSKAYVLPFDRQVGAYDSVTQLAQYVNPVTQSIANDPKYIGVKIAPTQFGFRLFDGTAPANPKIISFKDLIGQPTWLDFVTLDFKTVMRADIAVGDYIQFEKLPGGTQIPQGFTANSYNQFRSRATFDGTFYVSQVRHMGHFRQRTPDAWVTQFRALAQ